MPRDAFMVRYNCYDGYRSSLLIAKDIGQAAKCLVATRIHQAEDAMRAVGCKEISKFLAYAFKMWPEFVRYSRMTSRIVSISAGPPLWQ